MGVNLFFLVTGILVYQAYNQKPEFYKNGNFVATLMEVPQEKANSFKAVAEIKSFIRNDTVFSTHEQIIIYFSKEMDIEKLPPGSIIFFHTNPQPIKNFGNPYEFDYRKYLERKKIYRQVYLDKQNWIKSGYTENSLAILAEKTRQRLLNIYQKLPIDKKELEILSALTLGDKRDLDPETKHVFSSAGAMHVLAVSGLHVGIIFWIIVLLLGYLRKQKSGRIIFTAISIATLWGFAFITGLSPSVTRATAMFSIFIVGEMLQRKSNVYNSLAASAFFLLLFNPNNLFGAGFQLSYCAVFGIVYLQPKISSFLKIKNKIVQFFWNLFTVSVAAQIATVPFTLYYFGQFPTYFWITNIIIIPMVMILIPLGIFLLIVSGIPVLSNIIATIINLMIKSAYYLLSHIQQLPSSVLHTSISQVQLIFILIPILALFLLLKAKRIFYLYLIFIGILFLISTFIYHSINNLNKNELIIYNNSKNATLELIHCKFNFVISEKNINPDDQIQKAIAQTTLKRGLKSPQFFTLNDTVINHSLFLENGIVYFEGKTILFESVQKYLWEIAKPDFIVNPIQLSDTGRYNKKAEIIITNKRFIPNPNKYKTKFHNTIFETAFRKIW